jgi:hypothetical protein
MQFSLWKESSFSLQTSPGIIHNMADISERSESVISDPLKIPEDPDPHDRLRSWDICVYVAANRERKVDLINIGRNSEEEDELSSS